MCTSHSHALGRTSSLNGQPNGPWTFESIDDVQFLREAM